MPSDADEKKILHQRAVIFSAESKIKEGDEANSPYIKFRLSEHELYGIEFSFANSVLRVESVKKPPCVPPVVCGVINYQGKLIGVFDLEKILNLKTKNRETNQACNIIVVNSGLVIIGMLVGEIEMSDSYQTATLAESILGQSDIEHGFIKGIDKGKISILDVEKILKSLTTEGAVS